MTTTNKACNHEGSFRSHPPVPIQVGNGGALLVTAVVCYECGNVEYRSPPLHRGDEERLQERADEINRKQELLSGVRPIESKQGKRGYN